ncbi:hypothetical protein [Pseudorhodoplanes sp.]|uniref:hypothetical protein n=1 Tax=Pseudorhodoplanes sp. TaxID=1934341 RepID=UPI003D0B431D
MNAQSITWTDYSYNYECIDLRFDMPASLVPVENSMAATSGGPRWESYDKRITLTLNTKATNYGVGELSRSDYLATVSCDLDKNPLFDGTDRPQISSCESDGYKMIYSSGDESGGCSSAFVIAPVQSDVSRFMAHISLCSKKSRDFKMLKNVAQRIWQSASLRYLGCCKRQPNWIGCRR